MTMPVSSATSRAAVTSQRLVGAVLGAGHALPEARAGRRVRSAARPGRACGSRPAPTAGSWTGGASAPAHLCDRARRLAHAASAGGGAVAQLACSCGRAPGVTSLLCASREGAAAIRPCLRWHAARRAPHRPAQRTRQQAAHAQVGRPPTDAGSRRPSHCSRRLIGGRQPRRFCAPRTRRRRPGRCPHADAATRRGDDSAMKPLRSAGRSVTAEGQAGATSVVLPPLALARTRCCSERTDARRSCGARLPWSGC